MLFNFIFSVSLQFITKCIMVHTDALSSMDITQDESQNLQLQKPEKMHVDFFYSKPLTNPNHKRKSTLIIKACISMIEYSTNVHKPFVLEMFLILEFLLQMQPY